MHGGLDDESRLLVAAVGDADAYGELYRRLRDPLLGWFYGRTLQADVAADLAAETWARVLLHRERFDPLLGTARGFIWGVGANILRGWWRDGAIERRARERLGMPVLAVDDEAIAHVETLVDLRAIGDELRQAVAELPDGERAAVELRVLEGLDLEDVADRLACRPGAARVRVTRGIAKLRLSLAHLDPVESTDPVETA